MVRLDVKRFGRVAFLPLMYAKLRVDRCRGGHEAPPVGSWLAEFPRWAAALERAPLEVAVPWIAFRATDHIERVLEPGSRVFEWGTGGSTLYFARRAAELVSVEHDAGWHEQVERRFDGDRARWRSVLVEPASGAGPGDPSDPEQHRSSVDASLDFSAYCAAIDSYPDGYFHLVLVDGRARPSCIVHALPKVARGGRLVVDNSEREHYRGAIAAIPASWSRTTFRGAAPGLQDLTETSVWLRPPA